MTSNINYLTNNIFCLIQLRILTLVILKLILWRLIIILKRMPITFRIVLMIEILMILIVKRMELVMTLKMIISSIIIIQSFLLRYVISYRELIDLFKSFWIRIIIRVNHYAIIVIEIIP